MKETLRAFVAVELATEVKQALAGLIDRLRQTGIRDLRLVDPEAVHLTVKFLGDVPGDQVGMIAEAAAQAIGGLRAFDLELGGPGAFPNRAAPRVLWVGIEGDLAPMAALHQRIEDSLEPMGFPRDRRAFRPHLTLGRLRDHASSADRRKAAEALYSTVVTRGVPIDVSAVSLMRSTLLPTGAVYERLALMRMHGESE